MDKSEPYMRLMGCVTESVLFEFTQKEVPERETKPLVCTLPSYIKDTTDFLNKLASLNSLSHNVLFVSLEVTSLYTNIPQNEGINASRSFLQNAPIHASLQRPFAILTLFMSNKWTACFPADKWRFDKTYPTVLLL